MFSHEASQLCERSAGSATLLESFFTLRVFLLRGRSVSSGATFGAEKDLCRWKFASFYSFRAFDSRQDFKCGQLDSSPRCRASQTVDIFLLCLSPEPSCIRADEPTGCVTLPFAQGTRAERAKAQLGRGPAVLGSEQAPLVARRTEVCEQWSLLHQMHFSFEHYFSGERTDSTKV